MFTAYARVSTTATAEISDQLVRAARRVELRPYALSRAPRIRSSRVIPVHEGSELNARAGLDLRYGLVHDQAELLDRAVADRGH
jgi:hypothetical protein